MTHGKTNDNDWRKKCGIKKEDDFPCNVSGADTDKHDLSDPSPAPKEAEEKMSELLTEDENDGADDGYP